MNKEIEELSEIIPFSPFEVEECKGNYCKECKHNYDNISCLTMIQAERLYNAGYRKIVWHKVADGDLPKFIYDLVIAIKCNDGVIRTVTGNYRLERFNISDLGEIDTEKVIAWTELPTYEGEEQ